MSLIVEYVAIVLSACDSNFPTEKTNLELDLDECTCSWVREPAISIVSYMYYETIIFAKRQSYSPNGNRIRQTAIVFAKRQSCSPNDNRIRQTTIVFAKRQSYSPNGNRIRQTAIVFAKRQSYSPNGDRIASQKLDLYILTYRNIQSI
jgi:hypothetical protein